MIHVHAAAERNINTAAEDNILEESLTVILPGGQFMWYVLWFLSAFCLIYYIIIVFYAGISADFAWIWAVLALTGAAAGWLVRYYLVSAGRLPVWLKCMGFLAVAGLIFLLVLCSVVIKGMTAKGSENLDYAVVLGAHVKGTQPSKALTRRLEKALEYAEKNKDTVLILSGGQGAGEDITEARCMAGWLKARGISEDRMVLEDKSVNTKENLVFSDKITGCAQKKTGIISNNFHVYRAVKLAKKAGYVHAEGIAAASDPVMQLHYVFREAVALMKEVLVGNI